MELKQPQQNTKVSVRLSLKYAHISRLFFINMDEAANGKRKEKLNASNINNNTREMCELRINWAKESFLFETKGKI